MALVHVVRVHLVPQRVKDRKAPGPEHNFLREAVARIPAIEVVGQCLRPCRVFRERGIEKIDRNCGPPRPADRELPCSDLHELARDHDRRAGERGLEHRLR